ncbi:hypothetical protein B484DRAFT_443140 [Ochromonadaceae sp. CCMP2298]|nr:hypothetical protein B484DRAFT_443140 [Ochromonadaceae sp. CCMP2298]
MVVFATAGAAWLLIFALFLCASLTQSFHPGGRLHHRSGQLRRFCADEKPNTADYSHEVLPETPAVPEKPSIEDRRRAAKEREFQETLNGLLKEARENNVADGKGGVGGKDFENTDLKVAVAELKRLREGGAVTGFESDVRPDQPPVSLPQEEFTTKWLLQQCAIAVVLTVIISRISESVGIQ